MEIKTRLGHDRYFWMKPALDHNDIATMLVEVAAPPAPQSADAVPTSLVVVLDRSGSMSGARLEHAKRALVDVVKQLNSTDSFGLVTFDDEVRVDVPAGPLGDKQSVIRAIERVQPGGSTNLSGGLVEGMLQAQRLECPAGTRVLLVSDGHANAGVTDHDELGQLAARHIEHRVTTSTLGIGLGYDEMLLSAVAKGGTGNEHFAEEADAAAGFIAEECGDLLAQRFLSARLTVHPGSGMEGVQVVNDLPVTQLPDGVEIQLGGMRPDETRLVVLRVKARRTDRPGRRKVGKVRVDWVDAQDLHARHDSTTVWARVARDDERPAQADHEVMAEYVFQQVQRLKRIANQALYEGDIATAEKAFDEIDRIIKANRAWLPRAYRDELREERERLVGWRDSIAMGDANAWSATSKAMRVNLNVTDRKRGR